MDLIKLRSGIRTGVMRAEMIADWCCVSREVWCFRNYQAWAMLSLSWAACARRVRSCCAYPASPYVSSIWS